MVTSSRYVTALEHILSVSCRYPVGIPLFILLFILQVSAPQGRPRCLW